MGCAVCRDLLSAGLDLCVRARSMDASDRRASTLAVSIDPDAWQADGRFDAYVELHNSYEDNWYRQISTRSATIQLWLQDQYERDLAVWEEKSRHHLMQGCENG